HYNRLTGGNSAHYGRLRLFEELTRYELWDELIALSETPYLEPSEEAGEQVKRLKSLGAAWLRKGDVTRGIELLRELQERLRGERHRLNIAEPPPPATQTAAAVVPGGEVRPEPVSLPTAEDDGRLRPIELAIDELKGHLAVA